MRCSYKLYPGIQVKESEVYCGSQWFDITEALAIDLVKNEMMFRKIYKYSSCCDEVFIQTFVMSSKYKDKIYTNIFDNVTYSNMRYVDFSNSHNGSPRLLNDNDLYLFNSDYNFARKVDPNISRNFIKEYKKRVLKMN